MPASLVGNTFVVYFEVLPTTQVCRQNKASQRDLAVIHCLLFVNLLTNNHGKKPRLLELTPVLSAGRLEEPSRMCHPFLCCVLRGSGHVLCDAQVSITSPSNNSKVQVQHKRHVEYSTCLYRIKGADSSPWYTFFVFFFKVKTSKYVTFENDTSSNHEMSRTGLDCSSSEDDQVKKVKLLVPGLLLHQRSEGI